MNDFGFPQRKKRTIDDLNVVPILDMFVSIVFFLLLSASMIGMTKLVLPPSASRSIESASSKIPLNPTLWVAKLDPAKDQVVVELKWGGDNPGKESLELPLDIQGADEAKIQAIKKLVDQFSSRYPNEKTIQVSLEKNLPYQWLITVMDGIREKLPDVVLLSYQQIEAFKGGL
jgi:biopolymer transport protein ExbD